MRSLVNLREVVGNRRLAAGIKVRKDQRRSQSFSCGMFKTHQQKWDYWNEC